MGFKSVIPSSEAVETKIFEISGLESGREDMTFLKNFKWEGRTVKLSAIPPYVVVFPKKKFH